MNKKQLTDIFQKLGAENPDAWAESQIEEGIPQLARFLFLKGAWEEIVPDNEEWIEKYLSVTEFEVPFGGIAKSIQKMVECGVPKIYITELCRSICAEFLSGITHMLDDSSTVKGNKYLNWALVQLDENDQPIQIVDSLHESVLETDPTGRECYPREGI
jgi:hypothetical protein